MSSRLDFTVTACGSSARLPGRGSALSVRRLPMISLKIASWLCTTIFGIAGILFVAANVRIVILWIVRRQSGSLIPLIGGSALAIAMLVCPWPGIGRWAWIPVVVDLGCAPLFGAWVCDRCFARRAEK